MTLEMDKDGEIQPEFQAGQRGGRLFQVSVGWGVETESLGPSVCLGGWEAVSINDTCCTCLAPTWL